MSHRTTAIHPAVRVGHVHFNVADLERSIAFYCGALGFEVVGDMRPRGLEMVFLGAGDGLPLVALNTIRSGGTTPPPPGHTGLYHVAFVYPGHDALIDAVLRLREHGLGPAEYSDHGATVSVYVDDPDGNGVELYYERPREAWYEADGQPVLRADHFPIDQLINDNGG
jgi:catechol 2,3-dioxygenase